MLHSLHEREDYSMPESLKIHRRKFVTVRVTIEEKQRIEEIAKDNEKDVSTYVRELVLAQGSEQK